MEEITTASNKDKANIKPYRRYQLAILFLLFSFIVFGFLLYANNKELDYVLTQHDNLLTQLEYKMEDNGNFKFVLSRLEVNYVSLYQLDQTHTTDIIRTIREYNKLNEWILTDHREVEFHLCYKATVDGDNHEVFHNNCVGFSPMVFLFETVEGYRFGVYLSEAVMRRGEIRADTEAFVFSYDTYKKYGIVKTEVAYNDREKGFPNFGEGDISLVDGFLNHSRSSCAFPQAYEADPESPGDYLLTGGLRNFKLKEMEVMALFIELPTGEPELS